MTDNYLESKCPNCHDVVMYCECWIGEDRELSDSGEFTIHNGKKSATWNPSTRYLSGDSFIITSILDQLSGKKETICDVGTIWMEQREPAAVAFVAESLGYKLRGDGPKFGA